MATIVSNLDDIDKNQLVGVIASDKTKPNKYEIKQIDIAIGQLERDDISRVSPKARDVRINTCPKTGNEICLPTRHMVLSMKEAHAIFVGGRKNGEGKIACSFNLCLNVCPLNK